MHLKEQIRNFEEGENMQDAMNLILSYLKRTRIGFVPDLYATTVPDIDWVNDCELAFRSEYVDYWQCLPLLKKHIDKCMSNHNNLKSKIYMAPYFSMVQTSSSGKSRLLKTYGEREAPVIHIFCIY